jgi:hypothetical protein
MIVRSIAWSFAPRLAGLILLAALFSSLINSPSRAENLGPGGGTRVIAGDETVGPYRLFITSSPDPAQTGIVTFVVRITDPKTGETLKDADVRLSLTLPESNVSLDASATHVDAGNPVDYAAHVQIDQAGQYDGTIRVAAAAGPAEVKFLQRVLTPRTTSTLLVLALPFAAALILLGGFWYFRFNTRNAARQ